MLSGATNVDGGDPVPPGAGDLSICLYCNELLKYINTSKIQVLTASEFLGFPEDVQRTLTKIFKSIAEIKVANPELEKKILTKA